MMGCWGLGVVLSGGGVVGVFCSVVLFCIVL